METHDHLPSIWTPYQVFYIHSMLFNSASAMQSLTEIDAIFRKIFSTPTVDPDDVPTKRILDNLQNLVLQAASLSRYFWPVRKGHENRGSVLRDAFSINETSPMFDRSLRNALEHFDERLDNYLASGIVGYVFPEYVGPAPADNDVPGHFFRAYFFDRGIFRLLGEEFSIEPLAAEMQSIHEKLSRMDQQGGTLRRMPA
jgi:hypothetical protein